MRFALLAAVFFSCLSLTDAQAAEWVVDSAHAKAAEAGPGTPAAPFKNISQALAAAKAGDVVLVKAGAYAEAVDVTRGGAPNRPLTLRGDGNLAATLLGGVTVSGTAHVRIEGFKLTWPEGATGKKEFLRISRSQHVEVVGCEIFDKAEKEAWTGVAVSISGSDHVTVRDGRAHHVNLGIALSAAKDCTVLRMDVGPWEHEDGLRTVNCDRILVEDSFFHTHEAGSPNADHKQSGHVDGIQVIYGNNDLTFRNVRIHVRGQGLTGFTDHFGTKWDKPRKNIRIEGCIVEATNEVHGITFTCVEDPVVVNNTVVGTRINITSKKGGVVKNNIATSATFSGLTEEDYNLWMQGPRSSEAKTGPHDLVKTDPLFVDAAKHDFRLKPGSPAIDAADSSVDRGKDRAGKEPFDDPATPNKGTGPKPYLDRGALEYVPGAASGPAAK